MSKPQSGQLIRSNALTRHGFDGYLSLRPIVSILQCRWCRPVLAHHTPAVRQNAGDHLFLTAALSDITPPVLGVGPRGGRDATRVEEEGLGTKSRNSYRPYFVRIPYHPSLRAEMKASTGRCKNVGVALCGSVNPTGEITKSVSGFGAIVIGAIRFLLPNVVGTGSRLLRFADSKLFYRDAAEDGGFCSPDFSDDIQRRPEADAISVSARRNLFVGGGQFYEDFTQTTDQKSAIRCSALRERERRSRELPTSTNTIDGSPAIACYREGRRRRKCPWCP